jgi:hypothetical protein
VSHCATANRVRCFAQFTRTSSSPELAHFQPRCADGPVSDSHHASAGGHAALNGPSASTLNSPGLRRRIETRGSVCTECPIGSVICSLVAPPSGGVSPRTRPPLRVTRAGTVRLWEPVSSMAGEGTRSRTEVPRGALSTFDARPRVKRLRAALAQQRDRCHRGPDEQRNLHVFFGRGFVVNDAARHERPSRPTPLAIVRCVQSARAPGETARGSTKSRHRIPDRRAAARALHRRADEVA